MDINDIPIHCGFDKNINRGEFYIHENNPFLNVNLMYYPLKCVRDYMIFDNYKFDRI